MSSSTLQIYILSFLMFWVKQWSLLDFWLNPREQCQEMSWHLRTRVVQQTKRLVYWSLLDLGGNSDFISCYLIHMNQFWKFITFYLLCATCMVSHFSHVRLLVTLRTVACQTPLSMGFFRWEYWSGLPFPLPGDLPGNWTRVSYVSCIGRRLLYH